MIELPFGVEEGKDVVCGFVSVPEEYDNPDGPKIQLAVMILKSQDPDPQPDPLLMAQGGPGGSTIDTYASLLLGEIKFLSNRDIVLFDQRGTMYSKPDLICEEIDRLILETVEMDLTDDEYEEMELEAMSECRERLAGENINLSAYDSLENAADIASLTEALGYTQINLYGVSYGTLLALHTMEGHSEIVRSAILDAVVPRQINFLLNSALTIDNAFTRLFEACEVDPDCDRYYPNLEEIFFQLVDDFNKEPVVVPLTDPDSGISYQAVIDGDSLMSGLFLMMYSEDLIPGLPRMIYDARDGKFEFFSRIFAIFLFDRTMSIGMYYSVLCAEDADFELQEQDLSNVRPQIAEMEKRSPAFFQDVCNVWDVEPIGPEADQPVVSEIPTLILSGYFDPITPLNYGNAAASTLTNSISYEFPAGGHGQAFEGECQDSIILSFLDNPGTPPDSTCLDELGPPDFFTPSNIVEIPGLIRLLNLEGSTGLELVIFFLVLLILLSSVVVFPVAWLVKRLQRKPVPSTGQAHIRPPATTIMQPSSTLPVDMQLSPQPFKKPFIVNAASWMAVLGGFIILLFFIGLFIMLMYMVLNNDNRLFFGVTPTARAWFILPIAAGAISFGMIAASYLAWVNRYWSILKRLYYTILTVSSVICVAFLYIWGMLFAAI